MCVIQGDDQIVESSSTVNSVGTGSVNNTEQQPCPKEQIPGSNETRCIPGSKSGLAGSEFGEDGNVKMSLKCITYHGSQPTQQPTAPTNTPTKGPTNGPTNTPTQSPTAEPTKAPTVNKIKTEFKPPSHWCKGDQYADPLPETSGYASFTNTTDIQCLAICKQYNDQLYQWKGLWGAAPHWDGVVPFTTNVKIPGGNVNQYMNQMDETVTVEGPKWKNWVNFPEGTPCLRREPNAQLEDRDSNLKCECGADNGCTECVKNGGNQFDPHCEKVCRTCSGRGECRRWPVTTYNDGTTGLSVDGPVSWMSESSSRVMGCQCNGKDHGCKADEIQLDPKSNYKTSDKAKNKDYYTPCEELCPNCSPLLGPLFTCNNPSTCMKRNDYNYQCQHKKDDWPKWKKCTKIESCFNNPKISPVVENPNADAASLEGSGGPISNSFILQGGQQGKWCSLQQHNNIWKLFCNLAHPDVEMSTFAQVSSTTIAS